MGYLLCALREERGLGTSDRTARLAPPVRPVGLAASGSGTRLGCQGLGLLPAPGPLRRCAFTCGEVLPSLFPPCDPPLPALPPPAHPYQHMLPESFVSKPKAGGEKEQKGRGRREEETGKTQFPHPSTVPG